MCVFCKCCEFAPPCSKCLTIGDLNNITVQNIQPFLPLIYTLLEKKKQQIFIQRNKHRRIEKNKVDYHVVSMANKSVG